jgi:glutathionyl-hydroquinone reductase
MYNNTLAICRNWKVSLFNHKNDQVIKWLQDLNTRFSKAHSITGHAQTKEEYYQNVDTVFEFLDDLEVALINN